MNERSNGEGVLASGRLLYGTLGLGKTPRKLCVLQGSMSQSCLCVCFHVFFSRFAAVQAPGPGKAPGEKTSVNKDQ